MQDTIFKHLLPVIQGLSPLNFKKKNVILPICISYFVSQTPPTALLLTWKLCRCIDGKLKLSYTVFNLVYPLVRQLSPIEHTCTF